MCHVTNQKLCINRRDHHICLYNPLSSDRVRLPAFTLDNFLDTHQKCKFVVSCELKNPSSIGLAIQDGLYLEKLMFWNLGDEEWATFVEEPMRILDITSYKGGFCVLDGDLQFMQFDKENARGSPHNELLAFSQSSTEHDLRKNKIVVVFTTDFFRH